ncbi:MAG: hypothetical protein F6K19_50240 [Cyanothece sp. SIO1E1]|nr:hypothetical protein [Cyanothece sp. SIO1E1]
MQITAGTLEVLNGALLSASNFGTDAAGNVILEIRETAHFEGSDPFDGSVSRAASSIEASGEGQGGDVQIAAGNLKVLGGAQLIASTFGVGTAGNVILEIRETAYFESSDPISGSPSGAFSGIEPNGEGQGGMCKSQQLILKFATVQSFVFLL